MTLLAIPTTDEKTIFPKMLGMAKYFFIYKLDSEGRTTLIEKRDNPHEKSMQHQKTFDVYDVISDCSIIISAHIGKKGIGRLEDKGLKLIFRSGDIQSALDGLIV